MGIQERLRWIDRLLGIDIGFFTHVLRSGVCVTLSPTRRLILQSLSVGWSQDSRTYITTPSFTTASFQKARSRKCQASYRLCLELAKRYLCGHLLPKELEGQPGFKLDREIDSCSKGEAEDWVVEEPMKGRHCCGHPWETQSATGFLEITLRLICQHCVCE